MCFYGPLDDSSGHQLPRRLDVGREGRVGVQERDALADEAIGHGRARPQAAGVQPRRPAAEEMCIRDRYEAAMLQMERRNPTPALINRVICRRLAVNRLSGPDINHKLQSLDVI